MIVLDPLPAYVLLAGREQHIDLIRSTVADPYERLRLLFNLNVRGSGLR